MGKNKLDSHGDRMKFYENKDKTNLISKIPVIIRTDGKAFHSLTKNMIRPYDTRLITTLNNAVIDVCKNFDGVLVCYMQSDEQNWLISDFKTDSTQSVFNYNKSKLESVISSMMTAHFNKHFQEQFKDDPINVNKIGYFDARAFNIPFTEVNNYFYWRQKDNFRNAVSSIARKHYSDKFLENKNSKEIKEILLLDKNIDFDNPSSVPTFFRNGRCVKSIEISYDMSSEYSSKYYPSGDIEVIRKSWIVDNSIPDFHSDKSYINNLFKNYFTDSIKEIVYKIDESLEEHLKTKGSLFEFNMLDVCPELKTLEIQDKNKIVNELKLLNSKLPLEINLVDNYNLVFKNKNITWTI